MIPALPHPHLILTHASFIFCLIEGMLVDPKVMN